MKLINEWHISELLKNEEGLIHQPIEKEYLFYKAVETGNIEYIEKDFDNNGFRDQAGKGTLSKNPLQNIKYHFVVTTALITRTCASAGMSQEQAYRLSDFYILKVDSAQTIDEVCNIHHQMVRDFTQRMHDVSNTRNISKPIYKTIEYIYANIHTRITLDELAENAMLSSSHLSRLFKKEIGISVSDYIRSMKIERAKNLLKFSDFSYIDISNYLAFDSQSHFIKTFKDYEGITPKKYRDMHYQSSW